MTRAASSRRSERGFTLVEVVVSLVIVAGAFIPLLQVLGSASERVMDTVLHRKMRYLMQLQSGDVELVKISPDDEEERYEEGMSGDFNDFASADAPDEYDGFEWVIDSYREEVIIGGTDAESLEKAGFQADASGQSMGRPISNDEDPDAEEEPEGQLKRRLVLTVRRLGDTADEDMSFSIMTYLPMPDEEAQEIGEEPEGPVAPGGANAGLTGGSDRSYGGSAPRGDRK